MGAMEEVPDEIAQDATDSMSLRQVHTLEVVTDGGELRFEFGCSALPDAPCRRRPIDKNIGEWDDNTALDNGGHDCWAKEWIDAVGIEDALRVSAATPRVLAQIPVNVGYADGPTIIGYGQVTNLIGGNSGD